MKLPSTLSCLLIGCVLASCAVAAPYHEKLPAFVVTYFDFFDYTIGYIWKYLNFGIWLYWITLVTCEFFPKIILNLNLISASYTSTVAD